MYGKLINGVIEYAPKDYILGDGRVLTNFNSDIALLKKYGYKLIEDVKPSLDEETQYIAISSYVETEDNIIISYEVKNNTIPPTAEEKLNTKMSELMEKQLMTEQALQDLILMTMMGEGGDM